MPCDPFRIGSEGRSVMRASSCLGLLAVMALAACANPAEHAAIDRQRCTASGFASGTEGFATCMTQAARQREAEQAAAQQQAEQARVY